MVDARLSTKSVLGLIIEVHLIFCAAYVLEIDIVITRGFVKRPVSSYCALFVRTYFGFFGAFTFCVSNKRGLFVCSICPSINVMLVLHLASKRVGSIWFRSVHGHVPLGSFSSFAVNFSPSKSTFK